MVIGPFAGQSGAVCQEEHPLISSYYVEFGDQDMTVFHFATMFSSTQVTSIILNIFHFFCSQYLEEELGAEALKTMKRIKVALDPNNIMNPGKLIPSHVCF